MENTKTQEDWTPIHLFYKNQKNISIAFANMNVIINTGNVI